MDWLQVLNQLSSVVCATLIGIVAGVAIGYLLLPSFIYGRKPRKRR
ncbi:hypothetical protein LCGC14_2052530 [marine sediment metagenome]|uniref:Uncharacterized protein n=1 Tax=marine sediment metagenome TaxID=412755 RepID=A0A0F9ENI8_9ZZZZ